MSLAKTAVRLGCATSILVSFAVVAAAVAATPRASGPGTAQETERLLLSGSGYGDTVPWEFFVTDGRRSGSWTTIPVPSHWEQQGFGGYNYGHDEKKSREQGRYRTRFTVPERWHDRTVDLVFEGVMTDAEVRLNGEAAGPVHRGSFYRFRYDVTALLRQGGENLLEVTVSKHSSDPSVNRAERDADYWVFGGIYRPVYLEAHPRESMRHVAVDARHDGRMALVVQPRGLTAPAQLRARVESLAGEAVGAPWGATAGTADAAVRLESRIAGAQAWSAESPQLYHLVVELERDGQLLHRQRVRFGFRSVEIRPEGVVVNGGKVWLKGVNRHAFWPPSGRTLNRALDFRDAELIKSMNLNAVRMSHYPPDPSFLEACDELGLYVIDELAGWHDAYGTRVGRQLVREMVERDVNHPSVILWANGNEGGWNTALDEVFAEYDPQGRQVIHPHSFFGGIDTEHYLSWEELESSLDPSSWRNRWRALFVELPPVMPTELLHGLYDGGSGAGLVDYWRRLRESPRGAGLFLWSFIDEAIERTDRGGALDTDGNHAPDGVLGPYRELSGSFYAVRDVFAPISIEAQRFTGSLVVENRFDTTDLSTCRFDWSLLDLPGPGDSTPALHLTGGSLPGPPVPPGGSGELQLPPEAAWRDADALRLIARDSTGRDLQTWILPTRDLRADLAGLATAPGAKVEARLEGDRLSLQAATATARFDRTSGALLELSHPGGRLALTGPWPAEGRRVVARSVRHLAEGSAVVVEATYDEGLSSARWTLYPSGWLRLDFEYEADGPRDYHGVRFDLEPEDALGLRWLGGGPARVWKNRLAGARLGVWQKWVKDATPATAAHEPKLAGYYAGVRWAILATPHGELQVALASPDLYLGLFSPELPDNSKEAVAVVPDGGIGFLHGISAIGTKFHPAADLGPASQPNQATGTYRGTVWMRSAPRSETATVEDGARR
ncbi:MAG: glycoside hydrolase family 2 TIM barrel-domain containing protein [Acidobacteriota bacterium]